MAAIGEGGLEAVFGPLPPGWDTPLVTRTVTVLVEFNPAVVDESSLAQQVLDRLAVPQKNEVEGRKAYAWKGLRSHLWDSDVTWKMTHDRG